MCLIVVKNKPDASFSVEDFRTSYARNSDGTGIMYVENGRVVVEKTMGTTIVEHLALYYKHMNKEQFILHHRFATQGEKAVSNCHPFQVLSIDEGDPYDLYFAHNGNIAMSKFGTDYDKKLSDTHLFSLIWLKPLMKQYPEIIDNEVFQWMLADLIGSGNKLAFLRSDGRVWIFNRTAGEEHNGCWLSNKYSIQSNKTTTHYAYGYGKAHGAANAYNADEYDENYDYQDGSWFRSGYNHCNIIKEKQPDLLSKLSCDEIAVAIDEYAGLPLSTIEQLVIEDTNLAYDILNMLSESSVPKNFMDNNASKIIADKVYTLLQAYSKTMNIAA